jgi:ferritin-like metal-binding protein YciE
MQTTPDEEKAIDSALTKLAEALVNIEAEEQLAA